MSKYDLTHSGDMTPIDMGSASMEALEAEIRGHAYPMLAAAEIARRAGIVAEYQAFMNEMAVRGIELLIKGAKKAIG